MKTINNFINERLKISSRSNINIYTCHPKDKYELRKILEERLAEDKDANLNDIDVSKIKNMSNLIGIGGLFANLDPHNINISLWDVSNVIDMSYMFRRCKNFTGKGLENWDVSRVKDMSFMFNKCENFNVDLSNWDVSKVTKTWSMFFDCTNFEGNGLENWNVSNDKNMVGMFCNCKNFNADLSNWDVSKVEDIHYMFSGCNKFNCNLNKWNVSGIKRMTNVFTNCISLKNIPDWYKE